MTIEERLAALERRVNELDDLSVGQRRLGPSRRTAEDEFERQDMVQKLKEVVDRARDAKNDAPPVDRSKVCTTDGRSPEAARACQTGPGQYDSYLVLCDEERAKGFVRPVRRTYQHVGVRPTYPTRELTAEEHERYDQFGYVVFEAYPDGRRADGFPMTGRYWTNAQLHSGCRATTRMGQALAETYARDPKFYGSTFCVGCNTHLPVEEFVWDGTSDRVGS